MLGFVSFVGFLALSVLLCFIDCVACIDFVGVVCFSVWAGLFIGLVVGYVVLLNSGLFSFCVVVCFFVLLFCIGLDCFFVLAQFVFSLCCFCFGWFVVVGCVVLLFGVICIVFVIAGWLVWVSFLFLSRLYWFSLYWFSLRRFLFSIGVFQMCFCSAWSHLDLYSPDCFSMCRVLVCARVGLYSFCMCLVCFFVL